MNLDLTGKTAIVCGATQGIGNAAATELAQLGARIVLFARNEQALQEAVKQLPRPAQQEHSYLIADFQHPQQVEEAIQAFTHRDTAQILINNTG
ncbi:MAG: SDR family NAD(P)-dependent oxidoreductase, partial [Flavobacteriales bacterium]